MVEEVVPSTVKATVLQHQPKDRAKDRRGSRPQRLSDVSIGEKPRLVTGLKEFDRVMGGGVMRGSITLVAGEPGIGKSTLMTELGRYLGDRTVLYVTGEESAEQVSLRARRLGIDADAFYLFSETNIESILSSAYELEPDVLIIDSIQTAWRPDLTSAPGSVAQVRESTAALLDLTKSLPTTTFLVGHVTKSGAIAGPRVLEHMVDTVIYFEGDRHHAFRVLRAVKNRFGAAHELGIFEMRENGLVEVESPSAMFLADRNGGMSGSAVTCAVEGTRSLLVEVQALVTPASYGTPQRTSTGFEGKRLQLLLAVLEKRAGIRLGVRDVFVNVAGGVRIEEPAVDLGVILAVASSAEDVALDAGTAVFGEVGLGGEVRAVSRLDVRLAEARQMGFERIVLPKANADGASSKSDLELIPVERLSQAFDAVL